MEERGDAEGGRGRDALREKDAAERHLQGSRNDHVVHHAGFAFGPVLQAPAMARSKSKHVRMKMRRKIKHKQRSKRRKAALKATVRPAKAAAAPKPSKK